MIQYHTLLTKLGDPVSHLVLQRRRGDSQGSPVSTTQRRWSSITPKVIQYHTLQTYSSTQVIQYHTLQRPIGDPVSHLAPQRTFAFSFYILKYSGDPVSHLTETIRWSSITPSFSTYFRNLETYSSTQVIQYHTLQRPIGDPVSHLAPQRTFAT